MRIRLSSSTINQFNERISSIPVGFTTLDSIFTLYAPTEQDPAGTFRYNQGRLSVYMDEGMAYLSLSLPLFFDYSTFSANIFTFTFGRGFTGYFGTALWNCETSEFMAVQTDQLVKREIPKRAVYGLGDFIALSFTYRNEAEYDHVFTLDATVVVNEQSDPDPSGPYNLFQPVQMHSLSELVSLDKQAHIYAVTPTGEDIAADNLLDYVIGRVQEGTNFCAVTPTFDKDDAFALLSGQPVVLHNPAGDSISFGSFGSLLRNGTIEFA